MTSTLHLLHAAVTCDTQEHAQIFFEKILGLLPIKSFSIDHQLSENIFSISQPVDIIVYGNDSMAIEVFISSHNQNSSYVHLCISVGEQVRFIENCKENGLKPYFVRKGEKQLLFVRDFSGNLYEIKE
jgi:hypothetical protein